MSRKRLVIFVPLAVLLGTALIIIGTGRGAPPPASGLKGERDSEGRTPSPVTEAVLQAGASLAQISAAPDNDGEIALLDDGQSDAGEVFTHDDRAEQETTMFDQQGLESSSVLTFAITADQRSYSGPGQYDTSQYYRGACEAIADLGGGAFMISPGDIDPTDDVLWTITSTLGLTYTWYPGVGNHELPGAGQEAYPGANMDWLRSYDYGAVNPGPSGCPETTYSFDYQDVHFVMLNEYCDATGDTATNGDVTDHVYDWLADDLNATDQPHIFVFGHEPAYPQPDADNDRMRHLGDSLDAHPERRDRFWDLLGQHGVDAYVCGHTHNHSLVNVDGTWQLDAGHARGLGDTGARSTFIMVRVEGDFVTFKTYRDDANGGSYTLTDETMCGLLGDLDCDCTVAVDDITSAADRWRATEGSEEYNARYDLDDDGAIDVVDIMLVAAHWGDACE